MVRLVSAADDTPPLRMPPCSIDAECSLLGAMLNDNRVYDRVYDVLKESDFYRSDHRAIWHEMVQLIERNKPADPITLSEVVDIEDARVYLSELAMHAPSAVNAVRYAELVREKSILRSLISASAEIQEEAWGIGVNAQEVAEQAEARILSVLDNEARDQAREPVPLKDAVFEAVDYLDSQRTAGIATGYGSIDAMLSGGGLQAEQLIVIAGRPSMGKSALSYCLAERAAMDGHTCAYFALETSRREIGLRAIRWHEAEVGRSEAVRVLSELPLVIDDSPAIGLSHMRIRLRRIRRQRGLGLVVVDYMQLMRHRSESRLQEVSEISRGLKAIAKEFGVPVVAVAQLNRQTESRTDRRPQLSDLRESGQLEQDADVVMMCYRDEYYDPKTHLKGFGEVFVRKNKDGPTGEALLRWDGPRTRWIEYHGDAPTPPRQDEKEQPARMRKVTQDWSGKE